MLHLLHSLKASFRMCPALPTDRQTDTKEAFSGQNSGRLKSRDHRPTAVALGGPLRGQQEEEEEEEEREEEGRAAGEM